MAASQRRVLFSPNTVAELVGEGEESQGEFETDSDEASNLQSKMMV